MEFGDRLFRAIYGKEKIKMKALNIVLTVLAWTVAGFVLWSILPLLLKLLDLGNKLHHLLL